VPVLRHHQQVAVEVLAHDVPGCLGCPPHAAELEPAPLAERVVHEAAVPADEAPVRRLDGARLRRQVAPQECGERPLADETDAHAVALVVHGQGALVRDAPYLRLGESADREQRPGEERTRHGVQEIGLVLVPVGGAQQAWMPAGGVGPRVVAGGEVLRAQSQRVFEADPNLISRLQATSGFGVRPARSSSRKCANTRSRYSRAKLTVCSGIPSASQTRRASCRSSAAVQ